MSEQGHNRNTTTKLAEKQRFILLVSRGGTVSNGGYDGAPTRALHKQEDKAFILFYILHLQLWGSRLISP